MPVTERSERLFPSLAHPELDEILLFDQIDSTNLEARRLRSTKPNKNLLLLAGEQTGGIGQQGRGWESKAGMGIWATVVLQRDKTLALPMQLLSLYMGLVIQEVLQGYLPATVGLKWPNDVLVRSKKIAGILTELQWQGSHVMSALIGFGINVGQGDPDFSAEVASIATSMQLEGSTEKSLNAITQSILDRFFARLSILSDPERVTSDWNRVGWCVNREIQYFQGDELHQGVFLGINHLGQAEFRGAQGLELFNSGEIRIQV